MVTLFLKVMIFSNLYWKNYVYRQGILWYDSFIIQIVASIFCTFNGFLKDISDIFLCFGRMGDSFFEVII